MEGSYFYRFMCWYDQRWRRKHQVRKIDELVSLSFESYRGERKKMNDESWIEPGDRLGILHFNRECFSAGGTSARDYVRSGLRFRRLIMASFTQLAARIQDDPELREVQALHGISWLPPHGEKVGFMIEKVPDSLVNRVRKFYFRLLLKAFFPVLAARENHRLEPHAFWMTRQNLINNFSGELRSNAIRSRKNSIGEPDEQSSANQSAAILPAQLADFS